MNANSRPFVAALLAAGFLAVAGCGTTRDTPGPVAAASTAPPASATAFGGTDRAWLEITIAMDEELLPLLDLAPANAADPALRRVAEQVRALTVAELDTLRRLHDEAGLPSANPHKGMPMPGMVTPSLVAEAATRRGPGFDRLLATSLREHLRQGRQLAGSEQTAGVETRTKKLAASIVENRTAALERLPENF
ncbi:DUF305 domain-containing protein [Actinoplanes teichomyceticus]|uniref:DUF305 family protein family protein n=1 Tax=Actinoplanes teichomyceticus TaxID=1867 RepID=A0A561VKT8_ACTTI|nr:DUF305 domain-containing protein [Actinoplanes teichomyceticus]TWG12245.1 DUF305 family protein family protein [Actinoplanes teichomyceticus]